MSTITTINSGDLISTSRTDINTNFSNLNSDKIETSYLDTDTTLAANSDVKIPSQKAVKTYIDTSGGQNASETVRGIVEEATDAEVTAGTATGATGAKLFVTPAKLATQGFATSASLSTRAAHTIGALDNSLVKTYFNIQLPFTLWTGSSSGAATTDFENWLRSSTDVFIPRMGSMADFRNAGADYISLESPVFVGASDPIEYDNTNIIILDWWAKLPASGTGDINMGFGTEAGSFQGVWNDISGNGSTVKFAQKSTGELMAVIAKEPATAGSSSSDISSGLTLTNWNNYRIELDLGTDAKFYVNGTLKATLSGANLLATNADIWIGFGRSDTSLFTVTAPTLSLQMNP